MGERINTLKNGCYVFTQEWTNFAPKAKRFISEEGAMEYIQTYGMCKLFTADLIKIVFFFELRKENGDE